MFIQIFFFLSLVCFLEKITVILQWKVFLPQEISYIEISNSAAYLI